jgi:hypothetical protein
MSGLRLKEYYDNPETKALTALCRRDILDARIKLARDRSLPPEAREELWQLIDARAWFLQMVSRDYDAEIEQIDRQLSDDLA